MLGVAFWNLCIHPPPPAAPCGLPPLSLGFRTCPRVLVVLVHPRCCSTWPWTWWLQACFSSAGSGAQAPASRCPQGCAPSGGRRALPVHEGHLHSLACGPFLAATATSPLLFPRSHPVCTRVTQGNGHTSDASFSHTCGFLLLCGSQARVWGWGHGHLWGPWLALASMLRTASPPTPRLCLVCLGSLNVCDSFC